MILFLFHSQIYINNNGYNNQNKDIYNGIGFITKSHLLSNNFYLKYKPIKIDTIHRFCGNIILIPK